MTIARGMINLPTQIVQISIKYVLNRAFHLSEYLFCLNLQPFC